MNSTTIINIFTAILAILLVLALNVVKSLLLYTECRDLNSKLKKKQLWQIIYFFLYITYSKINSFIISILIQHNITSNLQKYFHQDVSFACLQFYKYNCLNILAGNIFFYM